MDKSKFTNEVREFVVSNFMFGDQGKLQDDTSFLDSGVVDSTGVLELIMFLENTYAVKIEPDEMHPENLDSISRVVQFLSKKLRQTPA